MYIKLYTFPIKLLKMSSRLNIRPTSDDFWALIFFTSFLGANVGDKVLQLNFFSQFLNIRAATGVAMEKPCYCSSQQEFTDQWVQVTSKISKKQSWQIQIKVAQKSWIQFLRERCDILYASEYRFFIWKIIFCNIMLESSDKHSRLFGTEQSKYQ